MKDRNNSSPDYKRIFNDIIKMKCPEKYIECKSILEKEELSFLDIIDLNQKIFELKNGENFSSNQKHRFYSKSSILKILDYQKKNRLNNSQTALHFSLSRNSITKWKKMFQL